MIGYFDIPFVNFVIKVENCCDKFTYCSSWIAYLSKQSFYYYTHLQLINLYLNDHTSSAPLQQLLETPLETPQEKRKRLSKRRERASGKMLVLL